MLRRFGYSGYDDPVLLALSSSCIYVRYGFEPLKKKFIE